MPIACRYTLVNLVVFNKDKYDQKLVEISLADEQNLADIVW